MPVSLDELCKHKEGLLDILDHYKGELRLETRNHVELAEGRRQYTPSPMATPDRLQTSLNFSYISGSGADVIDLSASFATTPGAGSTSKAQKSLFEDDDNGDDLPSAGR